MMKLYFTIVCALLFTSLTYSQTANYYNYTYSTGATLDPMAGATVIVPAGTDNTISAVQTIPFTFMYEGKSYTQFYASPDGFLKLGSTPPTANQFNNTYSASTMLFPFWDDLATGVDGSVSYVVTGTTPNQILKVQWHVTVPKAVSGIANSIMQAWLYESTNVIEFRYGPGGGPASSASIGISGSNNQNFISITTPANTASTATPNDNNTAWPGAGTMYSFTPPVVSACTQPTAQPTSLSLPDRTSSYIGGYFNDASPVPSGYLVVRSAGAFTGTPTDGTDYSQGATLGNGTVVQSGSATSFTAMGLAPNTQYSITIFSYNTGNCAGGPIYNRTSPLTGSSITCPASPGSPSASNITSNSAKLNWTSSLGGGASPITYTVLVATDNAFTSQISGSPFTVNDPTTTLDLSGLSSSTTYYYRIRATGSCTSSTSIQSFTTSAGALPLSMLTFNAKLDGRVNSITWITSQETNTSMFVVERSSNGLNFTQIGQLAAAGNSNTTRAYQYIDASPNKGMNYYRLKMIDRDANAKFSDVRSLRNTGNTDFTFYPNPVNDVIKIDINAIKADKGVIIVTGINGVQVYKRSLNIEAGNNSLSIGMSNIAPGNYIIKVLLTDTVITNKFSKL